MKVLVFNPSSNDETLTVKKSHFTESRREVVRDHIRKQTGLHHVWFEDEDPPPEFVQHLKRSTAEAKESGYWPDGSPYEEDD
jgi:hypothetical protein